MQWVREYQNQPATNGLYKKALIITVAGNILLAVSKGLAAYYSNSSAIYADAANSVSDVIYSLMMVVGIWFALQPPDLSHPQGHSRFEPLVGLLVTFSMFFAGYAAARESITRFMEGGLAIAPGLPTLVLLFSSLIKLGMFYMIRNIARNLQSPTLDTAAKDNLSDVLTSLAAFVGAFGSSFIHPLADPIAGFSVALWIFRAAFKAAKENLGFLTGAGASEELRHEIVEVAEKIPGVVKVHHMMTEYVGPRLVVDMHINVDGDISLNEAHHISDRVTESILTIPEVDRAYIHLEPEDWVDPPQPELSPVPSTVESSTPPDEAAQHNDN